MKKTRFINVVVVIMFMLISVGLTGNNKKITPQTSIKLPGKSKVPVFKIPIINTISQDLIPGQTLEVYGKNFGIKTFETNFYVGSYKAEILAWQNDFILLKFPNSPTLGKKIKSFIKRGYTIVSNQKEHILMANCVYIKPKTLLYNFSGGTSFIEMSAGWSGNNKSGMSLRFKMKNNLSPAKPLYSPVLSITPGGETNIIKANLPNGLKVGTYLVELIQNGRVASTPPAELKIAKFTPVIKKK